MKNFQILLLGSAELHRMLEEIRQFTKSTLGLLDPTQTDVTGPIDVDVGPHHLWRIRRVSHVRGGSSWMSWSVEFWSRKREGAIPDELIYSTSPASQREPALEDVQVTYDALEALADYFLRLDPMRGKFAPLLDAAAWAELRAQGEAVR